MWDRLLTDCHVATLEPFGDGPLGIITNAAIGIQDGRIVRVGRRAELAGYRAAEVVPLGGAWVTPGLIDCHTHLVFGGTRADEHAMRRAGATYEQIAQVMSLTIPTLYDLLSKAVKKLKAFFNSVVTLLLFCIHLA